MPRRTSDASLRTARRADRRLREATREAAALAAAGVGADGQDAWVEHACLILKTTTAERAGTRALGRLRSASRARPLADRIRVHALAADAALEQAAAMLAAIEGNSPSVGTTAAEPVTASANPWPSRLRVTLAAAAAFLVIGVVVAWWDRLGDTQPPGGEGILGGIGAGPRDEGDEGPASPMVMPLLTPVPSDGQADVESSGLTVDFDEVRMSSGIGAEWRQTAGEADAVAVAAFPTAVDRSARLEVIGDEPVEACQSLEPLVSRVNRLSVKVLVGTPTAMAMVSTGAAPGERTLRMSVSTSGTALSDGGTRVLAEGDGLETGVWYEAEIAVENQQTVWRVTAPDGPPEPLVETPIETTATETVGELCLAASGVSEDAVYFDDLTIATNEEG